MTRAYQRISFRGRTLNRRTIAMVEQAEEFLGYQLHVMQGSYNRGGVSASAGTHDGGGAVDLAWPGNRAKTNRAQWGLRLVGFAAWVRPELRDEWGNHIHCIAIGDREMSNGARKQVQDYYHGLNGLAGHDRDRSPRPNPIPVFQYPLKPVDLSQVAAEARLKKGHKKLAGVQRIQAALNVKTGTHLPTDGIFGPVTQAAYKRYEVQHGGDGNGIPGRPILRRLGLARFRVID